MPYVQFAYRQRGKLVMVKGQVKQKLIPLIQTLQYTQKKYQFECLQKIKKKINYCGNQFGQNLIITLLILAFSLANFFLFAIEECMIGFNDIAIASLVLWRYILVTFVTKSWRNRISTLPLLCLIILLVMQILNQFNNPNLTVLFASITIILGGLLLIDIVQVVWKNFYDASNQQLFRFQSNSIIGVYLVMKAYQVFIFQNTLSTLLGCICFSLINLLKINGLLEYDPIVLSRMILKENSKQDIEQNIKKRKDSFSLKKNIQDQANQDQKSLNNTKTKGFLEALQSLAQQKKRQQQQKQQQKKRQQQQQVLKYLKSAKSTKKDKKGKKGKKAKFFNMIQQSQEQKPSPYNITCYSVLIGAVIFHGVACFGVIQFHNNGNSQYVWYSATAIIKITIIILFAQISKQNILKRLSAQKYNAINLFINFLGTLPMSILIVYQAFVSIKNDFFVSNAIIGVLTLQTFHSAYFHMHQNRSNVILVPTFFFYVFAYSGRQLSMLSGIQMPAMILGIIMGVAVVVIRSWIFKDVFILLYQQRIKSKSTNKYNVYLLQKLKHFPDDFNPFNNTQFLTAMIVLSFVFHYAPQVSRANFKEVYIATYFSICYLFILMNVFDSYTQQKIQEFKISKIPFIFTITSMIYMIICLSVFTQLNDVYHQRNCSLILFILCLIYHVMTQLCYFFVYQIPGYRNFIKIILNLFTYWIIGYPFVIGFLIGYFLSNLNSQFLYYYAVGCFIYISIIVTILGLLVHNYLNLTQKTQKDLFIVKYMTDQMNKINLLANSQKFLTISNYFQIYDEDPKLLLDFLVSQMLIKVMNHQNRQIQYDYSFQDVNLGQGNAILNIIIQDFAHDSQEQQNLNQNDKSIKDQIDNDDTTKGIFIPFEESPIGFLPQKNSNYLELTRLFQRIKKLGKGSGINQQSKNQSSNISLFKNHSKINPLQEKNQLQRINTQNIEQCTKIIVKLFKFLSQPSTGITQQTFTVFLQILETDEKQEKSFNNNKYRKRAVSSIVQTTINKHKNYDLAFERFAMNSQINQMQFKNFILDYTSDVYNIKKEHIQDALKTFCKRQLIPILQNAQQRVRYHLLRRIIQVQKSQIQQWTKVQQVGIQFLNRLKKQRAKKAVLIKNYQVNLQIDNDQKDKQQMNVQIILKKVTGIPLKYIPRKDIQFKSPKVIYSIFVNGLVQCFHQFQKHKGQGFNLTNIKLSFSNILVIGTKLFDFGVVFAMTTIQTLITYINDDFTDAKSYLGYIDYKIIITIAVLGLIIYIAILIYHKKDFQEGTLGFDQMQRTLTFRNFKFYTTTLIFLFGSSFSTVVNNASLNAYLCDDVTGTLYNFTSDKCYDRVHFVYMMIGLLILIIYYPLALITFPYSSGTDRTLQIKYKSEYQVLYLQCRVFISGVNVIFDPLDLKNQFFVVTTFTFSICLILFIISSRMQPCSYDKVNFLEPKIFFLLVIFNLAGCLCFFLGVLISSVVVASLILIYFFVMLIMYLINRQTNIQLDQNAGQQIIAAKVSKQNNLILQMKLDAQSYQNDSEDDENKKSKNKEFEFNQSSIKIYNLKNNVEQEYNVNGV